MKTTEEEELFLAVSENISSETIGVIDIFWESDSENHENYTIDFESRKTDWNYIIELKYATDVEDIHIEIVNHTIHALFDLFGHNSSMIDAGFHRKDMFNQILIPYFRGISTKKGRKLLVDCLIILE